MILNNKKPISCTSVSVEIIKQCVKCISSFGRQVKEETKNGRVKMKSTVTIWVFNLIYNHPR